MKYEILRKSLDITFYLLIKTLCFNAIKCGKVTVKHNLLLSNYLYKRFFFAPSRNNKKPTDFKNELKISRFLYKIFFCHLLTINKVLLIPPGASSTPFGIASKRVGRR